MWVCLFLYGWYCPGVRLQIWVRLIRVISPYSNGAVQIQVGVELAEIKQTDRFLVGSESESGIADTDTDLVSWFLN